MKMKAYITGPMTGMPELNFPAFNEASLLLRSWGHVVVNPAELNPDPTTPWQECMRADIRALCDCTHIIMLDGWTGSKGAKLELYVAEQLGLKVEHMHNLAEPA